MLGSGWFILDVHTDKSSFCFIYPYYSIFIFILLHITFSLHQLTFSPFYSLTFLYFLLLRLLLPNNFHHPPSKHPVALPAEFSIHNPFTFQSPITLPVIPAYYLQISETGTPSFPPPLSFHYPQWLHHPCRQSIHCSASLCYDLLTSNKFFFSISVIHTFHHIIELIFTNNCFASKNTGI